MARPHRTQLAMSKSRQHSLSVYDEALARKQHLLQDRAKYGTGGAVFGKGEGFQLSDAVKAKLADAIGRAAHKARARDEARRKRDPKYRADALDLSTAALKQFDKYVDYYKALNVDQFASSLEVKRPKVAHSPLLSWKGGAVSTIELKIRRMLHF